MLKHSQTEKLLDNNFLAATEGLYSFKTGYGEYMSNDRVDLETATFVGFLCGLRFNGHCGLSNFRPSNIFNLHLMCFDLYSCGLGRLIGQNQKHVHWFWGCSMCLVCLNCVNLIMSRI